MYKSKWAGKVMASVVTASLVGTTIGAGSVGAGENPGVGGNPFSDPLGERYKADVLHLHQQGIINGFPDGSFRPSGEIARGDAALMLARALDYVDIEGNLLIDVEENSNPFPDVGISMVSRNAILALKDQGVIQGRVDGTFAPNDEVSRGEMAIMIANGFGLEPETNNNPFNDVGASARDQVQALFDHGITQGTSETTYGSDLRMIRADFSVMIRSSMGLMGDNDDGDVTVPVVDGIDLSYLEPGNTEDAVVGLMGEPDAVEAHFLGYDWLIYNDNLSEYVQVAVGENGIVKEVYSLADKAHYGGIEVGDSKSHVRSVYGWEGDLELDFTDQRYNLNNASEESDNDYLAKDGDKVIKMYLDAHKDGDLTGIRVMDEETAVKMNYYGFSRVIYGDVEGIHGRPSLTELEQEDVDRANEYIMYNVMNVNRDRFGLDTYGWDDLVSDVAYGHSEDMEENNFFSHESPTTGRPWDRMESAGLSTQVAENIAKGHLDGIEANAALMNSFTGHRGALLSEFYNEVGVGVYGNSFTQKFIVN